MLNFLKELQVDIRTIDMEYHLFYLTYWEFLTNMQNCVQESIVIYVETYQYLIFVGQWAA